MKKQVGLLTPCRVFPTSFIFSVFVIKMFGSAQKGRACIRMLAHFCILRLLANHRRSNSGNFVAWLQTIDGLIIQRQYSPDARAQIHLP